MAKARLVRPFDHWVPGYEGATVYVYEADGTTLAKLYYDIAATNPAPNPQVLDTLDTGCGRAGKFQQSVYTTASQWNPYVFGRHSLGIYDGTIDDLVGTDLSGSVVKVHGQPGARLDDLHSLTVHVNQFGQIETNAAEANTTLITRALAHVASLGGGEVHLPAGAIHFTPFVLPAKTRLRGQGAGVTYLICRSATNIIGLTASDTGLIELTVDGEVATPNSVGLWLGQAERVQLDRVTVQRFDIGISCRGGRDHIWNLLSLVGNTKAGQLWGNTQDTVSENDAELRGIVWTGGLITGHASTGLEIKRAISGKAVNRILLRGVRFQSNLAEALILRSAQLVSFEGCSFTANTKHALIEHNSLLSPSVSTREVQFFGCTFDNGTVHCKGESRITIFRACRFGQHTWQLAAPTLGIRLVNCIDIGAPATISGPETLIYRDDDANQGCTVVETDDATATDAWALYLEPGQTVGMEAHVVCRGTNNSEKAYYISRVAASRPAATLDYDGQTANFTLGEIITGATSGAKATVVSQTDGGATGTINLVRISGTFIDNELLTGSLTGRAFVDGVINVTDVSVLDQIDTTIYESDAALDCGWVGPAQEIKLQVTGLASKKIEWNVRVIVTKTK